MAAETLPVFISGNSEWAAFNAQVAAAGKRRMPNGTIPMFSVACDRCDKAPATLYCHQDKSHFCAPCDTAHHSSSKLLLKHIRKPVYHSPFQFGFCPTHPLEKIESACLSCGLLLCTNCVLTGSHAAFPDHELVSTVDAFRLSTSPDGDLAVSDARDKLAVRLKERHRQLHAIQANANEVQEALDKQLRLVTESAEAFGKAKLAILQASKRQTLLRLLKLEWAESFQVHMRLSLPATLWLRYSERWGAEETKKWFLAQPASTTPKLPLWLETPILISGSLEIVTADLVVPSRPVSDDIKVEWTMEAPVLQPLQSNDVSDLMFAMPRTERMRGPVLTKPNALEAESMSDVKKENVTKFVKATIAALNEGEQSLAFLPEPTTYSRPAATTTLNLSGGAHPFENAIQLVKSAPSVDRANLIRSCIQLFPTGDKESFVKSLISESVKYVSMPALAVSPPSIIVSVTSALCPAGDFLRNSCSSVLTRVLRSDEDALGVARTLLRAVSIERDDLPRELKFLLRSVAEAVAEKFGSSAGANAATCLFVARVVSPTLMRVATLNQDDVPSSVLLVCKQLQRIGHADDSSRDEDVRSAMMSVRSFVTDQIVQGRDSSLADFAETREAAAELDDAVRRYGNYLEV